MTNYGYWIKAASVAGCLGMATAAWAQGSSAPVVAPVAAPAAAPKGDAVVAQVVVRAKVTKINHKTRAVTLKADDGRVASFIADPSVKNLDQVKKGDIVIATYTEALAYEVKKGGKAAAAETTVAAAAAPAGAKPAGAIGQSTTVTVSVAAIDPKVPSVTFKGKSGKTRTIKVASADKLKGVSVGDTVQITYTEAVAIKVEKPPKK